MTYIYNPMYKKICEVAQVIIKEFERNQTTFPQVPFTQFKERLATLVGQYRVVLEQILRERTPGNERFVSECMLTYQILTSVLIDTKEKPVPMAPIINFYETFAEALNNAVEATMDNNLRTSFSLVVVNLTVAKLNQMFPDAKQIDTLFSTIDSDYPIDLLACYLWLADRRLPLDAIQARLIPHLKDREFCKLFNALKPSNPTTSVFFARKVPVRVLYQAPVNEPRHVMGQPQLSDNP